MDIRIQNLHTAIRRYCMHEYERWVLEYQPLAVSGLERRGSGYSDEALNIFPRYNVLKAILVEIERLRPEQLPSLSEAKSLFRLAVQTAEDAFTKVNIDAIEERAKNDERKKLERFIERLSDDELLNVEPLFYRRVLTSGESQVYREKLRDRWRIPKGYWFPLSEDKPPGVEAFQDTYFETEVSHERLRKLLSSRNIDRVFELQEWDTEYELELSELEPFYSGSEGYWCDQTFDWIIYASHESSITIGGWLLDDVKAVWPNWRDRIWTSPFFD